MGKDSERWKGRRGKGRKEKRTFPKTTRLSFVHSIYTVHNDVNSENVV